MDTQNNNHILTNGTKSTTSTPLANGDSPTAAVNGDGGESASSSPTPSSGGDHSRSTASSMTQSMLLQHGAGVTAAGAPNLSVILTIRLLMQGKVKNFDASG